MIARGQIFPFSAVNIAPSSNQLLYISDDIFFLDDSFRDKGLDSLATLISTSLVLF
jgi:hypothetical protein